MRSLESANNLSLIGEELLETISNNRFIIGYMDHGLLPDMDVLLDMRIILQELSNEDIISDHWIKAEMMAIDFLLFKHK